MRVSEERGLRRMHVRVLWGFAAADLGDQREGCRSANDRRRAVRKETADSTSTSTDASTDASSNDSNSDSSNDSNSDSNNDSNSNSNKRICHNHSIISNNNLTHNNTTQARSNSAWP